MMYSLITSLPLMTCALFSVLIALEWNNARLREQRILFVFMLTATMLYAGHYLFFNHAVHHVSFMDTIYVTTNLAVYPLYLIYIIRLTSRWKSFYWWMLLPAVIAAVASGSAYAMMTDEETTLFMERYLYHNKTEELTGAAWIQAWIHITCKIVFTIQVIVTIVMGVRMINRYDHAVDQFYADTEDKSMRNIQSVLYLVVITAVISFTVNAIGRYRFTDSSWLLAIPSIAFSVLLFAIGYLGLHRCFSIIDLDNDKVVETKQAKEDSLVDKTLSERIVEIVEKEKIYLQPNLKLEDLAKIMNTNRTYIYQAINQQMGVSFNEFINRRRVTHAERLMADYPTLSMNDIALQSGFASLSSFYRNLKKYKTTPTTMSINEND